MREIKFRAWDEKDRIMHYGGFSIHATGKIEPLEGLGPENPIVMQFTGLKDKNGKEIWEGDIIKTAAGYLNSDPVVTFSDGDWSYSYWKNELCDDPAESWEVIGNIHENPDLVKK
jgi:hypothetical protein